MKLILFMYCFPDFVYLSIYALLSELKVIILNLFIRHFVHFHFFHLSSTRALFYSFVGITFPWFFMFLEDLHCCPHIWRSSHLFQCLLTGLGRERRQRPVSLAGVWGVSQTFFNGCGCSTPLLGLFHTEGQCVAEIRIEHLLFIPESQSGYGKPLINFPWCNALKCSKLCNSAESSQALVSVLSTGLCPFVGGSCVPSAGEFGVLATGCEYGEWGILRWEILLFYGWGSCWSL